VPHLPMPAGVHVADADPQTISEQPTDGGYLDRLTLSGFVRPQCVIYRMNSKSQHRTVSRYVKKNRNGMMTGSLAQSSA